MAISNSERIGKGLDALRDGLQPVCERVWLAEYGENWVEVVNQRDQRWIISSSADAPVVRIRLGKQGWKDANGRRFQLSDEPVKFYDYNF